MAQKVRVIIGASYGDEGKGLATDYFGAQHMGAGTIVNVLTNGGAQRGHTVQLPGGIRHVFKHFGAASFRGAATYMAHQFIVNPMQLVREYEELAGMGVTPEFTIHPQCRFSTPWDMLANQKLKEISGVSNTCGFGIWETVLRVEDDEAFFSEGLLRHFEEDIAAAAVLGKTEDYKALKRYGTVLFENAQGLLLDGYRKGEEDFTTPSVTGVRTVAQTIEDTLSGADVEVCYVTRSYLTRHGAGPMESELTEDTLRAAIPGLVTDATNVENSFQGALRYGILDEDALIERIRKDMRCCSGLKNNLYTPSVLVTHMNEHGKIDTGKILDAFGHAYLSDGRTADDVHRIG